MLGDVISNAENIVAKGRLGPGQMVVADLQGGAFFENADISREWCLGAGHEGEAVGGQGLG